MKKIIFILLIYVAISIYGDVISRQAVIESAAEYANYSWIVNRVNPNYDIFSTPGQTIVGEAYSYGDKDNLATFQSNINTNYMPRNWEGNSDTVSYTGIDCSGLVWYCWGVNGAILGWPHTSAYVIEIPVNSVKRGDAYHGNSHYQIHDDPASLYEAAGGSFSRVKESSMASLILQPKVYSIFPQFSESTPKDGSTVAENDIEIGVTVRCKGEIYQAGTLIKVNNNEIKTFYIDKIDETTYRIGFTYERKDEETKCNVMVRTDNNISSLGNSYRDSIEWNFNVSNCIKELSVEPQTNKFTRKGEQRVFIFRFNWDPSAFKDDINVFLSSSTNEWQIGNIIGETGTVNLGNVENLILFKSLFYLHTIILVLIRNQNQLYFLKYSSISSRNSIPTCSKILSNF